MNKKITLIAVVLVTVFLGWYFWPSGQGGSLPTYFSYSEEELSLLRSLSSPKVMSPKDIYSGDEQLFDLVSRGTTVSGFDPNTSKIYAYLAMAERDAAHISFNLKGKFAGSLGPIYKETLCIFFKDDCATISASGDTYSEELAKIVLAKVRLRMAEDENVLKPYPSKTGKEYWNGPEPRIGIADGSAKTWFIKTGSQFRAAPPPAFGSDEFKEQLALTKKALSEATDEQKKAVVFWAGGPGTPTPPGIWLKIADDYMRQNNIELDKVLSARALLAMAISDAVVAVFDSKYTYWTRRPFMQDSSIITIMPTPNHPSYPAGHSTLSAAAEAVLSHFFPETEKDWKAEAEEGGMSRVWGGIHYPMDHDAGILLGGNVAREAISKFK